MSSAPIPTAALNKLWPHQQDALAHCMAHPGAMVAAPMGVGKSAVAIALREAAGAKRMIISAPKSVVANWPNEFAKHSTAPVRVVALSGGSVAARVGKAEQAAKLSEFDGQPCVIVVNHEATWREPMAGWIVRWRPDLFVLDESHRSKDPRGVFSKWLGNTSALYTRRVALTGTPMPHSPLDVFGQYRFLDPSIFGRSFTRFRARYAIMGGFEQKQVVDYQNTDELAAKFRRIAFECPEDVVSLPEAVDTTRTVELSPSAQKLYRQVERDLYAAIDAGEVTVSNALVKLLRLQQITGGNISLDPEQPDDPRRIERVDYGKQTALVDILEDLPEGEPVVVFARFTADLDAIHEAARVAGRSSLELSGRRDELARWQHGEGAVLATQIQAGGVGIDLTRARVCVYYSLGFSLGEYLQSRKRTHRPGQTRSVVYVHLVAAGTIDQKVYAALARRADVVRAVLEGGQS